ncbi:MAG: hypothetical protein HYU28_01690 [Actinobacteria bacterium]|nr:hypothetical protein [Actinomycetota bacterium]
MASRESLCAWPAGGSQLGTHTSGRFTPALDYAWPESLHAIEFDGGGAHDTVSARHDDRDRWRRLQRAGWTIWAVTERTSPNEFVAIGVAATKAL